MAAPTDMSAMMALLTTALTESAMAAEKDRAAARADAVAAEKDRAAARADDRAAAQAAALEFRAALAPMLKESAVAAQAAASEFRAALAIMLKESVEARAAENGALVERISSIFQGAQSSRLSSPKGSSLVLGGGGGGGGSGSGSSVRGAASPKSSPGPDSPLLAAVAAASPPAVPLEKISPGADSRALQLATRQNLFLHRLHTLWSPGDFDCAAIGACGHTVLPTPGKGLSLFAIVCEAPAAVAAAHALRAGTTKRHSGCSMRRLDGLPEHFTATVDRVLHTGPGGPIVWHVTLAPRAAMEFSAFQAAFQGWPAQPCDLKAAADVPPEDAAREQDCSAEELQFLTPRSFCYAAQKLAAAAEQRVELQLQAAGGSPG